MQNIELILSIAGTALGLLVTSVTFLMRFIKSAKAKRAAENVIKISAAILPYIKQAESFVNYSGQEKKAYVMTAANQYAIDHGMDFDVAAVNGKIEELVSLTKSVNKRDKDKFCAATAANASEYAQCVCDDFKLLEPNN